MVYKVLGLMSGSSLDGLDLAYVHFHETGGKWNYEIVATDCYPYPAEWKDKLKNAFLLSALDYQLLHTAYGHYIGQQVNNFIENYQLNHKVHLVASHGHTVFHVPGKKMTAQLGDGAAIAALTGLPVVSDLRALDIAFGGQGAPIVPIGEKLLLPQYDILLNIGGIANISFKTPNEYIAFDICAANRVLDMLANKKGKDYDNNGSLAASGTVSEELLKTLNSQAYYTLPHPKSLANDFGTDIIFPIIDNYAISVEDKLRTYVEHIVEQVKKSINQLPAEHLSTNNGQLLTTGGGTFNSFLITRLQEVLSAFNINVVVPEKDLVNYKEAIIMGLIGVLRWREEYNVLSSVTGALRNSIGGALWLGGEA